MRGRNDKNELRKSLTKKMRESIDEMNLMPGPGDYNLLTHSFDSSDSLDTSLGGKAG